MSSLTVLLCLCMALPLLSLKCRNDVDRVCTADPSKSEYCYTGTVTWATGKISVTKACGLSTPNSCVLSTYCNDKDGCNSDDSDYSAQASVTQRKCKCSNPPNGDICDAAGECLAVANVNQTAMCGYSSNPLEPTNPAKTCWLENKTQWTAYPSVRVTVCGCNTDMCNDWDNPTGPTTRNTVASTASSTPLQPNTEGSSSVTPHPLTSQQSTATSSADANRSFRSGILLSIISCVLLV